jgi:polyphosphate glucokinase
VDILGIDIGGSGIKGAPVDIHTGELSAERFRIDTPQPATPKKVAEAVQELSKHFNWDSAPIGCTFPAIVKRGVAYSAANVDESWIGANVEELLNAATGCPVHCLNDADAAGLAEIEFGAARGVRGLVILLTFGTGIGSAFFWNGELIPNTELGHMEIDGKGAEKRCAASIREKKSLGWKKWAKRVDRYLKRLEFLFSPELIVVGGGVSKKADRFFKYLEVKTRLLPAAAQNEAGIIGAAMAAHRAFGAPARSEDE